jgi:hypothetical protein
MPGEVVAGGIGMREDVMPRERSMERISVEQHSASGLFWLVGWLFTIGILHLPFWKAVLAIVAWPYYLGAALEPLLR